MAEYTQYVAGFAFYKDMVLLVLKNKPEWQRGRSGLSVTEAFIERCCL